MEGIGRDDLFHRRMRQKNLRQDSQRVKVLAFLGDDLVSPPRTNGFRIVVEKQRYTLSVLLNAAAPLPT